MTSGRQLVAVKRDGTIAWQHALGDASSSSPAVAAAGTIVVGTQTSVKAVNPGGDTRWEFVADAVPGGVAFDADGTILFGTHDGRVFALTPQGSELWQRPINPPSQIFAPPVVGGDGAIYVSTVSGWIYAFEPDGSNRWSVYVGPVAVDSNWPGLSIDSHRIVHASTRSGLVSVETDGTIRSQTGPAFSFTTPVVNTLGDRIVGSGFNGIVAYTSGGSNRWSLPDSPTGATAVASDGSIYVGTYPCKFQAFSPFGSNLWQTTMNGGGCPVSSVIAPDGTIYVVTDDGKLHSIFGTSPPANTAWPMFQRDSRHTGRAVLPDFAMAPPTIVSVTEGSSNGQVRLTWRSVHGAVSYEIWRMNASNLFEVTMVGTTTASTIMTM